MNERNRNQMQQLSAATQAATLPALPVIPASGVDHAIRRFLEAVKERLEVREGARGNPFERVVTRRDLVGAGLLPASGVAGRSPVGAGDAALLMQNPDGTFARLSVDEFSAKIYQSPLFQSLSRRLSDAERFDDLPDEVRSYLLNSIAEEAARRGADIRNTEFKLQTELRSLAYKVEEVTAAVGQSSAGLREMQVASATADEARAEQITQLEARMDLDVLDTDKLPQPPAAAYATLVALQAAVPVGDPSKYYRVVNPSPDADPLTDDAELLYIWDGSAYLQAGVGGVAQLEQRMTAVANRVKGTEAQYTVKVNAGGAMAGFGLAASSPLAGEGTSAFIVQADKIAFVSPIDELGTDEGQINPASPPASRIPFGVDTVNNIVYINGQLRVGSPTGPTMDSITTAAGVYLNYNSQFFKYGTDGNPVNTSVTLTASVTGGLEGTLEWSAISGYSGTVPANVTITTSVTEATFTVQLADITADTATFSVLLTAGVATYTDTVTLVKLRDGSDAYTGRLTNDSAGVATDSAGAPVAGGFGAASGVFEVYRGATKLLTGVAYSIIGNTQSLMASINSTSGAYSVTAKGSWPDATRTAVLQLQAVVTNGPTLTKDFTLTKNPQGVSGYYTDYVFYRTTGTPPTPPTGWSDAPPAGTDPLYMSSALRDVLTDTVSGTWSTPARLDGDPGADGSYVKYQWAVNASTTTAPTTGWSDTALTPSTGQFVWMRQGTVVPPATTPASWGAAYRVSGEKGDVGQGQTKGVAFTRSTAASVSAPTGGSFASPTPTTAGWSDGIPSGTAPLWQSTRMFTSDGASPQQSAWTTPQKVANTSSVKYQFSTDNATWSDTASVDSLYMRTGISDDGGKTWTYSAGVNIKGEQGVPGKVIRLSSTASSFLFADENATSSTSPTISFTANLQNITGTATFTATARDKSGTSLNTITLGGTGNTRTLTAAQFAANAWTYSVDVTATLDGQSDTETVYRVDGGMSAVYAEMTNGSHPVPTDSAGSNAVYTGSGTEIRVKEGDTLLDYVGVATSVTNAGTWALDITGSTATSISISATRTSTGTTPNRYVIVGDHTSMTADTASIKYKIVGKTATGANFTVYTTQTFAKAKGGINGAPGARGTLSGTGAQYSISSTAWSDAKANRVINNLLTGETSTADLATTTHLKIGDRVTLSGTSFVQERAWSGTAWLTLAMVVDGNLLVNGTVVADKIAANQTFVGHTIQSTTYTAGSAGWQIKSDGSAEFNNVTVRGAVEGSVFRTAAAAFTGDRMTLNNGSDGALRGYDANNVQRTVIDSKVGYVSVLKNASAAAVVAENTSTVAGGGSHGGIFKAAASDAVGVEGRSTSYIGGAFYGGTNSPPIFINPNGSLPTAGAIQGSLCVVGGKLYFHNGTAWKEVQLV